MMVAVTGATGFCGRAVVGALQAAGHSVIAVGRRPLQEPGVSFVAWHAPEPLRVEADRIIHLAAHVGDRGAYRTFARVNVAGTTSVLALGIPTVYISTASVYASCDHPVDEQAPLAPRRSHYARSKAEAEVWARNAGAVILRPRAVYGVGDPYLEPRIVAAVRRGRLIVPGPSRPASLTHVETLADACVAALDLTPGAYNVADPEPYDRDEALGAVLNRARPGTRLVHAPVTLSYVAARIGALVPNAPVTRYAVDQLARPIILSTEKLASAGFTATRTLDDYLRTPTP